MHKLSWQSNHLLSHNQNTAMSFWPGFRSLQIKLFCRNVTTKWWIWWISQYLEKCCDDCIVYIETMMLCNMYITVISLEIDCNFFYLLLVFFVIVFSSLNCSNESIKTKRALAKGKCDGLSVLLLFYSVK